jgi:hypothetical protein
MSVDIHFFEIGIESEIHTGVYSRYSVLKDIKANAVDTEIENCVQQGAIPSPAKVPMKQENERLTIRLQGDNQKICVFFLSEKTRAEFASDTMPFVPMRVPGIPSQGYIKKMRTYGVGDQEGKWASFSIKKGDVTKSSVGRTIRTDGQLDGHHEIIKIPFYFNIMDSETKLSPVLLGNHHDLDFWQDYKAGENVTHGGIHPDSAANFVIFDLL